MKAVLFLITTYLFYQCSAQGFIKHKPAQGIFSVKLNGSFTAYISKTVYNLTEIFMVVSGDPNKCKYTDVLYLDVAIIGTMCKGLYSSTTLETSLLNQCLFDPVICTNKKPGKYIRFKTPIECTKPASIKPVYEWKLVPANESQSQDFSNLKSTNVPENTSLSVKNDKKKAPHSVATVDFMGEFIVIMTLIDENDAVIENTDKSILFDITVRMKSPVGYLSADEYPLLTFYLIMCIVYVFYALAWLIMSACNYHDLLRVQFWIGGVILLGLIEKAVHYSEYLNVNTTGVSEVGTEKFAAFVACIKRTVARMLVIIVSLGFGIVKPRLGPTLHKVIGIGLVYFIVALLEQMLSIDVYFNEGSREAWVFMYIPLAIIDSMICYWIFISLLQTMKLLRLRRNTTKLALYRHFANTVVFCVLISVGMMLWAIYYHEQGCSKDFANSWFETACWPMLFSFILLVIMILWRPNVNNQRYAYSPMIDGNESDDDDDMEEPMLGSGATETIKMRGSKQKVTIDIDKTEEDLKWIEENIPQTVADAALPVLLDSDEEVVTTKYEMSKME